MEDFESMNLDDRIMRAVRDMGFEEPTPVQIEVIPLMLKGKEVMAQAQTGTGKTAAFGISILDQIEPSDRPVALVIVPTRELATQVAEEINELASHMEMEALAVYGGQAISVQIEGLKEGREIVVGTPGRLLDHIRRKTLDLSGLDYVVLDEADRMLDMGFIEDIENILSHVKKEVNTSLFSATIPPEIQKLARKYMHDPEKVIISEGELTLPSTEQAYINIGRRNKIWALCRILDRERPKALVFCSTKKMVDILAKRLKSYGYKAETLHGDMSQAMREKTLKAFKEDKIHVLVASDVAARGLDIEKVTHVINYDIPDNPEDYVHRIGRTGRAGATGKAITFVSSDEQHLLKGIKDFAKSDIAEGTVPQTKGKDVVRKVWDFDEMSDIYGMVKFQVNLGSRDGFKLTDFTDMLMKKGEVNQIAIGDVDIGDEESTFEVHKDFAQRMLGNLRKSKIKGKKVKLFPVRS
ncbi:MAG: DEAD/DEAH box helicase [Methanomassiliicoccales archaeon]